MKTKLLAVALVAILIPTSAQAMTVQEFLGKVSALKAKGMMAAFSSDVGLLKRESATAITQIRADRQSRAAAGKPPLYCPPANDRIGANEMIGGLSAIPPSERGMSLKDGFLRVIVKRYPCR